jgi:NOL1/NOP2/fmu family ribosome biogenesis protein
MIQDSPQPPDFTPTASIRWDSSWPGYAGEADRRTLLGYLEERFGIPCVVFDDFVLLKTTRSWHLLSKSAHLGQAVRLKAVQAGLKAFEQVGSFIKPTTRFVQLFGRQANKAVVEIDKSQLRRLLAGERISVDPGCGQGYVILALDGYWVIGLGLLLGGEIRSQLRGRELAGLDW